MDNEQIDVETMEKIRLKIRQKEAEMSPSKPYADAPEQGWKDRETVVEMLLQELEKRSESLAIQVGNLHKQFHLVLMEKTPVTGREDNPTEKYPAHSPLAKRLETLNEVHKEIAHQLNVLSESAEI